MSIGPIQAFVIGFPDNELFEGRIAEELARLSDVGEIRIIDAVFVIREDGEAAVVSVSDLDDTQRTELRRGSRCADRARSRRRRGGRWGRRAGRAHRSRRSERRRGGGCESARRSAGGNFGAGAGDRAPLGDPATGRGPGCRWRRAGAPLAHRRRPGRSRDRSARRRRGRHRIGRLGSAEWRRRMTRRPGKRNEIPEADKTLSM